MSVNRNEVKEFLKSWANTKSPPHFAVLIEGQWGCGKTHFVTELLKDEKFTKRKTIYLSVFGIADIQSLETSLFFASASKAKKTFHKGLGLAGSIFGVTIPLGSGGILDGTANLDKVLGAVTSKIEKSAKNMDKALLILDDLERCQIPMSELLGIVNRLVEHGDTRVVLCANTDQLNNDHFKAFKEKIVGHSFLLENDPESALKSFIKEISEGEARRILTRYQDDILKLYRKSGLQNLRALRQFVWHSASILEKMEKVYLRNDELVQNLIRQFFIFLIEFTLDFDGKTSSLTPQNLLDGSGFGKDGARRFVPLSIDLDKDSELTCEAQVLGKYGQHSGIRTVITVQQWISILTSGVVDKDRLNAELAESSEVTGVASWSSWPSWRRLSYLYSWDFSDGSETDFWSDIKDMQLRLKEGRYLKIDELLHVAGVSLMLADHELIDQTAADTVAEMKAYIDNQFIPNLTYESPRGTSENDVRGLAADVGLDLLHSGDDEFKEIMEHLIMKLDARREAWLRQDADKRLLEFLTEDWMRFVGNLSRAVDAVERNYLDKPILATIDVADFVDAWLSLSPHYEQLVLENMEDRYKDQVDLLDQEGPWWKDVAVELTRRVKLSKSKPRNFQIKQLIKLINSLIIEKWERRQSQELSNGNSTDLG